MDGYKKKIIELVEKITPITPLEVRTKREKQSTKKRYHIALEVKEIT